MKLIYIIASLFLLVTGAKAQEQATALVCDTAEQVTRYLNVVNGDPRAAVSQVNEEVKDPTACILTTIAYIRGAAGETVRNKDGTWKVTEILVVAVITARGWQQIAPAAYFSAVKVEEEKGVGRKWGKGTMVEKATKAEKWKSIKIPESTWKKIKIAAAQKGIKIYQELKEIYK